MIANPTPRYYRIYRLLKQAIEGQQFDAGRALPGENALAGQYGVSRLTIRRSLDLLQQEGLVERRQGAGTFPCPPSAPSAALPADINKLMAHLSDMGANTQARLLSFGYEAAGPDVRTRLELPAHAKVQKALRVRYYHDQPFSYLLTYVPESVGRRYTEVDLGQNALQRIFRRLGLKPTSAEQSFTAILADVHHAEALDVGVGSPLLCIKRVVRDADGTPLEYLIAAYNPARFEYRMALSNRRAKGRDTWVMDETGKSP